LGVPKKRANDSAFAPNEPAPNGAERRRDDVELLQKAPVVLGRLRCGYCVHRQTSYVV
jgi:hypothetical protein